MIADLDRLMATRSVDAVIVPMHEAMHASFRWFTRGAKVTRGYVVKVPGRDPLLVAYPMERDEAAMSGLEVRLAPEFDHEGIFRTATSPGALICPRPRMRTSRGVVAGRKLPSAAN